jgi:hypothetical protein
MSNKPSNPSRFVQIIGSIVSGIVITIFAQVILNWLYPDDSQKLLSVQSTQIPLQATQNALSSAQLQILQQKNQIVTPMASDTIDYAPTATAYARQLAQIESTSVAISAKQTSIVLSQTAVAQKATKQAKSVIVHASSTPEPVQSQTTIEVNADDVISQVKNGKKISDIVSGWQEYNGSKIDGTYAPFSIAGYKCYGVAWNTQQFGYHSLIVFQNTRPISFGDGGFYVSVCVPDNVGISLDDIGNIKVAEIEYKYPDVDAKNPWRILVNP